MSFYVSAAFPVPHPGPARHSFPRLSETQQKAMMVSSAHRHSLSGYHCVLGVVPGQPPLTLYPEPQRVLFSVSSVSSVRNLPLLCTTQRPRRLCVILSSPRSTPRLICPFFSSTYELPIPQPLSFHNHLRCRGGIGPFTKISFCSLVSLSSLVSSRACRLFALSLQRFSPSFCFFSTTYRHFLQAGGWPLAPMPLQRKLQ